MKQVIYALILSLVVVSGLVFANREIKNETSKKSKAHDKHAWLQKFCPRRAKSIWSKINTGHVERLIGLAP